MISCEEAAANSFMFPGIACHYGLEVPGIFLRRFFLPPDFGHETASARICFFNRRAESVCGYAAPSFSVQFIIPGQSVVEVVPAAPVVRSGPDPQETAVQAVQAVLHFPGGKGTAADMGMEVFSIDIDIPGSPPDAAFAFTGCFAGQVEDMADSDMAAPVTGTGLIAVGTAVPVIPQPFFSQ